MELLSCAEDAARDRRHRAAQHWRRHRLLHADGGTAPAMRGSLAHVAGIVVIADTLFTWRRR